jgi:branched-chain amino acid transport system substrate-binding protein
LGKVILVVLLVLFSLPACLGAGAVSPPQTLKIGLVAPFEGLHRPLGYEALFGVKLALQERNAAQGVGGYRVELVALNDFDDPLEAEKQAGALSADPDVVGVIGHFSAATTQAALPVYRQANLALVVPWSAAALESDRSGVVSVAANLAETEARLATMGRDLGLNSILEIVKPDVTAVPASVQALTVKTEGVTAGEILVALRQAGMTMPVLGQVETGSLQTVQVAQAAAEGFIFVSPGPDPRRLEGASAFVEAYQELAGFPPGPRAVLAYDATQVLLDALEQSLAVNQTPLRATVSAVIGTVQRQGLSGEIAFNRRGERVNAPVWIYQVTETAYPGVLLSPR